MEEKMKKTRVSIMVLALLFCVGFALIWTPVAEAAGRRDAPTVVPGDNRYDLPIPRRPYRVVFTMFIGTNPVAREIEAGFISAAESVGINLWSMDN